MSSTSMKVRVGARISNIRERLGWTQEAAAAKMKVSRASLSHYEMGRREPDLETIAAMADALNVTVDYLLDRKIERQRLFMQWLDEPCPAIQAELKAKIDALEDRLKGETQHA
ncbi:helix-turn-helix domain-containing protein [Paenibacillus sp. D9]|uniref:helix-turn-helix domain-containing protein n=1 Tax=Paenibacillus sp. D9 TaxID=665792 RepID=UPI00067628BA|nr:helix-turn-helix transcriptional regulator [Paenibacillus sp. D9]